MAISDKSDCEVRIDGVWTHMSAAEAHARHRNADKRCPDCHGRVRAHGTYGAQQRISIVHRQRHDGCPRMPRQYAGTPKPHPDTLA